MTVSIDRSKFGSLIFEEEFSGTTLDQSRWMTNYPWGLYEGKPTESSFVLDDGSVCSMEPANTTVSGGYAQMLAKVGGSKWGRAWSAPLITTKQTFGPGVYIEGRMQFPAGQGFWPAFWLAGTLGEIDIVEGLMANTMLQYVTVHWDNEKYQETQTIKRLDLSQFVVYGLLWTKTTINFYQDDVLVATMPWQPAWTGSLDQQMNLMLNLSVGGNWGGPPDPKLTEGLMLVDWVRVHEYVG